MLLDNYVVFPLTEKHDDHHTNQMVGVRKEEVANRLTDSRKLERTGVS
jgi:hypothetical protein